MFTHRFAVEGTEACGRTHVTTTEARDCEVDYMAMMQDADLVYCALCDGIGHGQPGYGPCPLEMRGVEDTYAEEAWEAARGVVSYWDAAAAAL